MYMYRALNEYDILVNPLENGIASKKLIYDLTKSYLESNEKEFLNKLTDTEKDKYIKGNMKSYIINHSTKLEKKFNQRTYELSSIINRAIDLKTVQGYILFKTYLSSLNNHLVNGTKSDTNWISSTTDFNSLVKYYNNQNIHKVALIKTDTNGLLDKDTFVVNLSSREKIDKISYFLCNKIDQDLGEALATLTEVDKSYVNLFKKNLVKNTSSKFMGYNYSINSNEVCIYNYLKKEKIVNVLEALEMDLLICELLEFKKYLLLPSKEKEDWLNNFKIKLDKEIKLQKDSYLEFIYHELYDENKNINIISDSDKEKIHNTNIKILRLASKIPDSKIIHNIYNK